jgi:hypothetical protein
VSSRSRPRARLFRALADRFDHDDNTNSVSMCLGHATFSAWAVSPPVVLGML